MWLHAVHRVLSPSPGPCGASGPDRVLTRVRRWSDHLVWPSQRRCGALLSGCPCSRYWDLCRAHPGPSRPWETGYEASSSTLVSPRRAAPRARGLGRDVLSGRAALSPVPPPLRALGGHSDFGLFWSALSPPLGPWRPGAGGGCSHACPRSPHGGPGASATWSADRGEPTHTPLRSVGWGAPAWYPPAPMSCVSHGTARAWGSGSDQVWARSCSKPPLPPALTRGPPGPRGEGVHGQVLGHVSPAPALRWSLWGGKPAIRSGHLVSRSRGVLHARGVGGCASGPCRALSPRAGLRGAVWPDRVPAGCVDGPTTPV